MDVNSQTFFLAIIAMCMVFNTVFFVAMAIVAIKSFKKLHDSVDELRREIKKVAPKVEHALVQTAEVMTLINILGFVRKLFKTNPKKG